jgi:hypothetical protein
MNQNILVQSGTTLFHVAAQYLGDATEWYRIAQVNNIADPFLSQMTYLVLPSLRASGGQGNAF